MNLFIGRPPRGNDLAWFNCLSNDSYLVPVKCFLNSKNVYSSYLGVEIPKTPFWTSVKMLNLYAARTNSFNGLSVQCSVENGFAFLCEHAKSTPLKFTWDWMCCHFQSRMIHLAPEIDSSPLPAIRTMPLVSRLFETDNTCLLNLNGKIDLVPIKVRGLDFPCVMRM